MLRAPAHDHRVRERQGPHIYIILYLLIIILLILLYIFRVPAHDHRVRERQGPPARHAAHGAAGRPGLAPHPRPRVRTKTSI
jgi:hypothetical protein